MQAPMASSHPPRIGFDPRFTRITGPFDRDPRRASRGTDLGDQKRVTTPGEAIANGSDHIVVGRPIWRADDPRQAALDVIVEINPDAATQLAQR